MDQNLITNILMWIVPLALAIILHEIAHGWVANYFGDPTAKNLGRLTMNPVSHIDPIGTIAVPALLMISGSPFLFGWAKPVPVMIHRLRNPRTDMIWVALAGPGANLIMAICWMIFAKLVIAFMDPASSSFTFLLGVVEKGMLINILLMVFNLLPMLPLDGGRVLHGLLPQEVGDKFAKTEPFGMLIVVVLLATGILSSIISPAIYFLMRILYSLI